MTFFTSIFKGKTYHDRHEQIMPREKHTHRVNSIKMQRQEAERGRRGTPVLLGLERTTSIEGTTKLCESASAPGFAMIGASGAPDRTRPSTYQ